MIDLAILEVLNTMPLPVPDTVVVARLPEFYAGSFDLPQVQAALTVLKDSGDVKTISKRYSGLLYFITPSGKAALA